MRKNPRGGSRGFGENFMVLGFYWIESLCNGNEVQYGLVLLARELVNTFDGE